jgi:replicative DNA helicase
MATNFRAGSDAFAEWRDDLVSGKPPKLFPVADGGPLSGLEVGPGRIVLLGGQPGAGKTALTIQLVTDAVRLSPELRVVVGNCEMPPAALLDRMLARLSGVPLGDIRHRRLTAQHADRLDVGLATLEGVAERLAFCRGEFSLRNIAATADTFAPLAPAGGSRLLICVDYVQRLTGDSGPGDRRGSLEQCMSHLRQFADAGAAVLVVSAVGRQRDRSGSSTYANLNLASFRESGELEFGADDAFVLAMDEGEPGSRVLRHLKSRHGEPKDVRLTFRGEVQAFTAAEDWSSAIASAWDPDQPPEGARPWR